MIFVTYGTQPHNFKFMGELVNQIDAKYQVQVQQGESKNNITRENTIVEAYTSEFDALVANADIIITHGGVGSIMTGLKQGKKVIAISRLEQFCEHVDNHQIEVTTKLANENYIYNFQRGQDINQVLAEVEQMSFAKYESNTTNFVQNMEKILKGEYR